MAEEEKERHSGCKAWIFGAGGVVVGLIGANLLPADVAQKIVGIDFQSSEVHAKAILNSTFILSVSGGFAGAFAGAWGAQRIADKGRERQELLQELRDTNAAIIMAFGLCNALFSMKKQHIVELKARYDDGRARFFSHRKLIEVGERVSFEYTADLQKLSVPPLSIDILQHHVLEKLSLSNRPILVVNTILQTIHTLDACLEQRNQLIDKFRVIGDRKQMAYLYFGAHHGDNIDVSYPDTIFGISNSIDDAIYFGMLLCSDLERHADRIRFALTHRHLVEAPKVNRANFDKAHKSGLVPPAEPYRDWDDMK